MAEVAGDLTVYRAHGVGAGARAGDVEVLELLWRYPSVSEDVVGHARRTADAHRVGGGTRNQQGVIDVREVEELVIGVEEVDIVVAAVRIVAPGVEELAFGAEMGAVAGMFVVRGTPTAFDITAADLGVDRHRAGVRRIRGDHGRRTAQDARLLRAQQWIAAVDVVVAAERIIWIRVPEQRRRGDRL